MNPMKMKMLDELLAHLDSSQGMDLKSMLMKKEDSESPAEEAAESPEMESMEDKMGMEKKPKGLSIEKVSVMGKPMDAMNKAGVGAMPKDDEDDKLGPIGDEMNKVSGMDDENEMSDDELAELLKKVLA